MITMDLMAGDSVCIGTRTLEVLAVRAGEVVVALVEPQLEAAGRRCPVCRAKVGPGPCRSEPWYCPRCGFSWDE